MEWEFNNDSPIHTQLVNQLTLFIITEQFRQGEKIPSVRELANSAKVNPNTMQKALMELEDRKLIFTKRTNGKYVTEDKKVIEEIRDKEICNHVNEFLRKMSKLKINKKEIMEYVKEME